MSVAGLSWITAPGATETDTAGPAAAPPPIRRTARGLPGALSTMVMAPLRFPAAVGVKVTLIVHELPAATEPPHPLVCAKSPEAAIEAMDSAPLPLLDNVTSCAGEVEPMSRVGNVRVDGDRLTLGARTIPVPDAATACGLPEALLATETAPVRTPAAVGLKVTAMVQDPPAATEAPQELDCAKSPEAEMALMARGPLPVLESTTVFAVEDFPTSTGSNARLSGESETPDVTVAPVPDSATPCGLPAALLATESEPDLAPDAVGVKVTLIVHDEPAAIEEPQPLAAKSPEADIPEIASGLLPVLARVTNCAGDVEPSSRDAKESEPGDSDTAGASTTPVPVNDTDGEPPEGLAEIDRLPVRVPDAAGANVTEIAQLALGASVPQLDAEKSPDVETLTLAEAVPELVTVTVCTLDELPTFTEPKDSEDGDAVITGAVAGAVTCPLNDALVLDPLELETDKVAERAPGMPVRLNVTETVHDELGFCRLSQSEEWEKDDASVPEIPIVKLEEAAFPTRRSVKLPELLVPASPPPRSSDDGDSSTLLFCAQPEAETSPSSRLPTNPSTNLFIAVIALPLPGHDLPSSRNPRWIPGRTMIDFRATYLHATPSCGSMPAGNKAKNAT